MGETSLPIQGSSLVKTCGLMAASHCSPRPARSGGKKGIEPESNPVNSSTHPLKRRAEKPKVDTSTTDLPLNQDYMKLAQLRLARRSATKRTYSSCTTTDGLHNVKRLDTKPFDRTKKNYNLPDRVVESCNGDRGLSQSSTPREIITTIGLSARKKSEEEANSEGIQLSVGLPERGVERGRTCKNVINPPKDPVTPSSKQKLPNAGAWTIIFPRGGSKPAHVDKEDIPKLDEGNWLNDNLIQFYLRWLQDRLTIANPELAKSIFFHNTFFYETLAKPKKGKRGINYDAVKRWTAKVDLISFKYIIVPINENGNHWYVAVICNPSSLLNLEPFIIEDSQSQDKASWGDQNKATGTAAKSSPALSTVYLTAGPDVNSEVDEISKAKKPLKDRECKEWHSTDPTLVQPTGNMLDADARVTFVPAQASTNQSPPPEKLKTKDALPVCHKYPATKTRIITLDSRNGKHDQAYAHLTDYLGAEIKSKHGLDIPPPGSLGVAAINVPQQNNCDDCGPFLLIYIQKFLENPDEFVLGVLQQRFSYNIQWPNPPDMRNTIRHVLMDLRLIDNKQSPSHSITFMSSQDNMLDEYGVSSRSLQESILEKELNLQKAKIMDETIGGLKIIHSEDYCITHICDKIQTLQKAMFYKIDEYDREMQLETQRSPKSLKMRLAHPLRGWKALNDANDILPGQQARPNGNQEHAGPSKHGGEANSVLRKLLITTERWPNIPWALKELGFSSVHVAFIGHFCFDILQRPMESLFEFPGMKSTRSVFAAVRNAGDARKHGEGVHLLREVLLRTWDKSDWKSSLLSNAESFLVEMKILLEPLTQHLSMPFGVDDALLSIIRSALELWSYLVMSYGKLIFILPVIGSDFDPSLHVLYDRERERIILDKDLEKKKIAWILRPGLKYFAQTEDEQIREGPPLIIKARVFLSK